uniref:hypothetical protein n=1 Tax=Pararhizobium sp. IMCC3301 TaxID=3067904 RepID=UPI0027419C38|nr:hypothetical protein [Pararhizobium sp. IMCC3301]
MNTSTEAQQDSQATSAGKVKQSAAQAAEQLADKTERVASDAIHTAKTKADEEAVKRQTQMQTIVRKLGRAIDAGSASLERDGMPGTAGYVRAAARGFDRAADEVDSFNPQNVTSRVENFVRQKPLVAAGVLAAAGFAFATFLNTRSGK